MPAREALSVVEPELMKTTTIVPSAFLKAATSVLVGVPDVATRTASGLI
jgi:hypothetical protein